MQRRRYIIVAVVVFVLFGLVNTLLNRNFFRIDLTSEKRYSISQNTKHLMQNLHQPVMLTCYLDGDLNPGFLRLRNALRELLDEFDVYADGALGYKFVNPSQAESEALRNATYMQLAARGLNPTTIYEHDAEGKSMQKTVFPWVEIVVGSDTFPVNLLKNIPGNSGADNLNISIENLEYALTDALRSLNSTSTKKIAFIEGHGELSERYVHDASLMLSRYFQIDRGTLTGDVHILDSYAAVIVAHPQEPFTEAEKYVLDQYIMRGGRVMWLLDGVTFSYEELMSSGVSPLIARDLNLTDMLFAYGVRVNASLLQDVQCVQMPISVSSGSTPQYEAIPWYFSPLLLTSPRSPITRNMVQVNGNFCSSIDFVGERKSVKREVLLYTSNASYQQPTPSVINLAAMMQDDNSQQFNMSYLPVAVLLEGSFGSVFRNRLIPEGVATDMPTKAESDAARMIVVADGDIIANDVVKTSEGYQMIPMGMDRYSGMQFGNRDFVLNSLLYLTDEEGWFDLRNRTFKVRMLNKHAVRSNYLWIKWINIVIPILLVCLCGGLYLIFRYVRNKRTI